MNLWGFKAKTQYLLKTCRPFAPWASCGRRMSGISQQDAVTMLLSVYAA